MSIIKVAVALLLTVLSFTAQAQHIIKGKVIDAFTKEPIAGASVRCSKSMAGCSTGNSGDFQLEIKDTAQQIVFSFIGYHTQALTATDLQCGLVTLQPYQSLLQEVVISANREGVKRSQAPVAISSISTKMLQDAKPNSFDQVLNKVSGVYMVNLGNEQHQMSIRQPMTTKSLFLYLEDGIPIRTTGLFNHNALLEINMASVKNIEVIKGPSSSLYGSEAIGGVVNFITMAPTNTPQAKLSLQANNGGYKRADVQSSFMSGKWGFVISGYYAAKQNGLLEYTDFDKKTISARADYSVNKKTTISNSITWMSYYSDMPGGIDSAMFVSRTFTNPQTFTYRKVDALRNRSTLLHNWNERGKTTASLIFRNNSIAQNPAYSIKDDYRKQGDNWVGKKDVAHGEINKSSFNSYASIIQHRQNITWKNVVLIGGVSVDASPSAYVADYILIRKDSISKKYVGFQQKDSTLTNYKTAITNYAGFINFEFSPVAKMRVVTSLRYDLFHYHFNNNLKPSSFSGTPDTANNFKAVSPKVGLTYNFSARTGLYANYSQGFVPPQVTELYRGVKVPELKPSTFYNYEVGGWMEVVKNKLTVDFSTYHLQGTNEVISVRLEDGTNQNMNSGKTLHKGIEAGINCTPFKSLSFRFSGAYSNHTFVDFKEKGIAYDGHEMNGAPAWMHNAEVWYNPIFAKGLRLGAEWQKVGSYFMDPANTVKYKGFNVVHVRAGYQYKAAELWVNLLNATDGYYANIAVKSASGYSYTPADPRTINIGIAYNFGALKK